MRPSTSSTRFSTLVSVMPERLLDVRDLSVSFRTESGIVRAVDAVSFSIGLGEVLGIVGESGSGKTVAMLTVMRLIRDPNAIVQGQVLYRDRDLDKAKQAYGRLLQEPDEKSLHASSYYGLARIAILQKDPELAERLFQKALGSSPDPQVRAWVEVYLGRLSDAAGERDEAVKHYKEAVAVEGGSAAAKEAAQKGMQQSFQK